MGFAILRHRLYGLDVYVDPGARPRRHHDHPGRSLRSRRPGRQQALRPGRPTSASPYRPPSWYRVPAAAATGCRRGVKDLCYGQRDEPYSAISTLGRRLGDTLAPDEVLPVIVETIAEALRVPYVAVTLDDEPGMPAAQHGAPVAGVAHRPAPGARRRARRDSGDRRPCPRREASRRRPPPARGLRPPGQRRRQRRSAVRRNPALARTTGHRARGGKAPTARRPPRRARPDARRQRSSR